MYLTKITLKPGHDMTGTILCDCQAAHRYVMSAFPNVNEKEARKTLGVLYKTNFESREPSIIIQSKVKPDRRKYEQQACTRSVSESLDMTNFINSKIDAGRTLIIRADLNIASNRSCETGQYRYQLSKKDEFINWITKALQANGATFLDCEKLCRRNLTVKRNGKKFEFFRDTVNIAIEVNDSEKVKTLIENGLGKNKSYGCGMLLIS